MLACGGACQCCGGSGWCSWPSTATGTVETPAPWKSGPAGRAVLPLARRLAYPGFPVLCPFTRCAGSAGDPPNTLVALDWPNKVGCQTRQMAQRGIARLAQAERAAPGSAPGTAVPKQTNRTKVQYDLFANDHRLSHGLPGSGATCAAGSRIVTSSALNLKVQPAVHAQGVAASPSLGRLRIPGPSHS